MTPTMRWLLYSEQEHARCGCTGECGLSHTDGRCGEDQPANLKVAPIDPGVTTPVVGVLPDEELGVWCRDCHTHAVPIAREHRSPVVVLTPQVAAVTTPAGVAA